MNEALLDVNVLIAARVENHAEHDRAKTFINSLDAFYTTPTTQGGFLRFMTRPWKDEQKREQPPRKTIAEALVALNEIVRSSRHRFLPDDEQFTTVPLRSISGHRQWTDAYLLQLARKHGLKFATFERKLNNMDDVASPTLLLVP